MQPDSEPDQFVLCSGHTILECRCGERTILIGLEEDWYLEGHTVFGCECGEELTLADSLDEEPIPDEDLDEEALGVRELLRSLRTPGT
ncbi:MAG: hypothetical protein AVDCRST_MAG37-428 [uncultured Rubrobacteraceae bacterium]|uniref:Uncharacterized protein n=1 Tax=uncultured Rubrobacteraceae bacterium TaxID=349277 RepID=A0A6J4Q018_9ACTN|nr:MAG: hypothetical protein AVDCRST_MAG37-428 [uncultured Rubrobacteraceae bacterium]